MRFRKIAFAVCWCAITGSFVYAQVRVDVLLVNVVTTVVDDQSGRLVHDLTPEDFIVEDDGVPQTIAHLSPSFDTPISMGVVLDTSGSMKNKMRAAQVAVDRFIHAVHPDDDIFLMTFASHVSLISDFTSDRNRLTAALNAGVDVSGSTVLYDGVYQALEKIKHGVHQKKAVLLITDGEDTNSSARFDRTLQNIRQSEMLVYCIGIRGNGDFDMMDDTSVRPGAYYLNFDSVDMKILNAFADESGGKAWQIMGNSAGRDIQGVLDQVAEELRGQYSIGYYPSHPIKDGAWHTVHVKMKDPRYHARARKGYVGK